MCLFLFLKSNKIWHLYVVKIKMLMRKVKTSNTFLVLIAMIILFGMTSCNRGYGCPGEFSLSYILNLFSF